MFRANVVNKDLIVCDENPVARSLTKLSLEFLEPRELH
jgi:hypothetical protein